MELSLWQEELKFGDIDDDFEVQIILNDNEIHINKQQAELIVKHLQEQFKL